MKEDIKKLENKVVELEKMVKELTFIIQTLRDSSYKTGQRDIINHEVQFLQKVYRADGTLITQINT